MRSIEETSVRWRVTSSIENRDASPSTASRKLDDEGSHPQVYR